MSRACRLEGGEGGIHRAENGTPWDFTEEISLRGHKCTYEDYAVKWLNICLAMDCPADACEQQAVSILIMT